MRILVVDDDDADHLHLQNLLTDGDHEIIRVDDPDRALQAVCEHDIRLVIANWSDSSMGALTLCRDIRQLQRAGYTYYIVATARKHTDHNYELASMSGIDDFLFKPVNAFELRMRLDVAERILGYMSRIGMLNRLVTICTYCKRLRDEEEWMQIETVIRHKLGTDFSHGICPECRSRVRAEQTMHEAEQTVGLTPLPRTR
jgi:CheY-like chemotaxis protein